VLRRNVNTVISVMHYLVMHHSVPQTANESIIVRSPQSTGIEAVILKSS